MFVDNAEKISKLQSKLGCSCFGTTEYSNTNLICKNCKYYILCSKIKYKIKRKPNGRNTIRRVEKEVA